MTVASADAPIAQTDDVLVTDVTCMACGYNLRGLSRAGRCPECATEVRQILERIALEESFGGAVPLAFVDPRWVRRRAIACAGVAATGLVMMIIVAIEEPLQWPGGSHLLFLWTAAHVLMVLCIWGVTAAEPMDRRALLAWWWRAAARILAVADFASFLLNFVVKPLAPPPITGESGATLQAMAAAAAVWLTYRYFVGWARRLDGRRGMVAWAQLIAWTLPVLLILKGLFFNRVYVNSSGIALYTFVEPPLGEVDRYPLLPQLLAEAPWERLTIASIALAIWSVGSVFFLSLLAIRMWAAASQPAMLARNSLASSVP